MQAELKTRLSELERLNKSGKLSDDDYTLALRERRGLVLAGNRLAMRRSRKGVAVSELRDEKPQRVEPFGSEVMRCRRHGAIKPPVILRGKAKATMRDGVLVRRDESIKLDKQLVSEGFRSMLVKVVKGKRPQTAMELASGSIMEQIKASLGIAE